MVALLLLTVGALIIATGLGWIFETSAATQFVMAVIFWCLLALPAWPPQIPMLSAATALVWAAVYWLFKWLEYRRLRYKKS